MSTLLWIVLVVVLVVLAISFAAWLFDLALSVVWASVNLALWILGKVAPTRRMRVWCAEAAADIWADSRFASEEEKRAAFHRRWSRVR